MWYYTLTAKAFTVLCAFGLLTTSPTIYLSFSHAYAATNPSKGFADLVEKLSPAVVNISTTSIVGV